MNIQLAQNLQREIKRSLDLFESTGPEQSRANAHEKALHLAQALARPREAILRLSYLPSALMAVKVAHDLNVFTLLAQATRPVPLTELAASKAADPRLVEQIMRTVVASGFAEEPLPCEYLPNAISREMTERGPIGMMESIFLEFLPSIQKASEYLRAINYRNPDDRMRAPLQSSYRIMPTFTPF
ncbi:hypothetical protein UA08_08769 [Talaromyces atroroseus]|uniref:O-methyltransferase dimerisation domain-containing protein n=1 Tax=Talaromyces atroroseus TaxID=1441469 RepID=A0A225AB62_TALAT|nr:hypothetical protein UA08_08769 [Talaromyces atroroseus]OKL55983.1 hypothetical protein UA08_08769 [Talaromyces atroroseus]